jgi:hypothetical protein
MSHANATTDHEKIRKWAEARGGHPATVRETETDDEAGILRLDFDPSGKGLPDKGLDQISWNEFFDKFEDAELAFLYQEKTSDGKASRFHKFVDRDSVDDDGGEE